MPQPPGFRERLEEAVGKNTAAFARRIGEAPARLYPYLSGRTSPPMDILAKIADAAGVDPRWLLTGKGSKRAIPDARVPILGRATAGPLAPNPGTPGPAQEVRLDIAGLLVTIRVEQEPSEGDQKRARNV